MAYNTAEISQLLTKQAALDKALGEAREKETRLALIEIVQKMREYDISLYELMGRKPGEQPSDVQPKYRDPDTGATWGGRGRAPQWIVGKDRERFLVGKAGFSKRQGQETLFPELR
ncbi:H-NS family nucleoid-associated regulatory protein [Caballeronia novacaledonica]|uniref:H-NS histone family protein n=1 Tax=Caballeronia novacaledonica TaxID=1544861 RepID=A0AA37MSY7_9BURK|nr:H-NS histone family protein [Caballeronia novacaledonica]GJH26952.1 H-NS histone family protein [Caballeronia novacaledonica]